MNKQVAKFLEFNGKAIVFLEKDGTYWIAIKPVCEAININYNRAYQNIVSDPTLGAKFAKLQTLIPGDSQPRRMIFLQEKYIYGWLFKIRSDNPELRKFQMMCYEVMFDYFKGTITKRSNLLKEKLSVLEEKQSLLDRLSENEDFRQYELIKGHERKINKSLSELDRETIVNAKNAQGSLFDQK